MLSKRNKIILLLAAIVVAAVLSLIGANNENFRLNKKVGELQVYTLAAERMVAGEEIYRPDEFKAFTYPPFFALPFLPFAFLPQYAHRPVWYCCNILLLLWCIGLLRQSLLPFLYSLDPPGLSRSKKRWMLCIIFLLAARHLTSPLENQSHDLFVLLALMLAARAACHQHEGRSGFFAGFGAACKATPLLFGPVFVWQRRIRAAIFLTLGTAFLLWLPDLLFPRSDGGSWIMQYYHTFLSGLRAGAPAEKVGAAWSAWNMLNQNLAGSLYRLFTPVESIADHTFDVSLWHMGRGTLRVVTMVLQVGVLGLILWGSRPGLSKGLANTELGFRRLGEIGAVACGMVLLSPMSSKSHFCVLLIPIAFCTLHYLSLKKGSGDKFLALHFWLILFTGTFTARIFLQRSLSKDFLARGTVTLTAILCLTATVYVLLQRRRSFAQAHQPQP